MSWTRTLSAILFVGAMTSSAASAQAPAGYIVVEGAFINGSGIGRAQSGQTVNSCAAACNRETRCLSFEFRAEGGWCSLNAANRSTRQNILTRVPAYRYFEKSPRTPSSASEEQLFIYRNCREGRCTLGVGDADYAPSGSARRREGWRRVGGPFDDHPAAWRRACEIHASGSARAPDITSGRIDCAALGVPPPATGAGSTTNQPTTGNGGGPDGYVVVEGAFINGSGIGRAQSGQTVSSCAAACDRETRCLSFEFRAAGGWCSLNAANRGTRPNILTRVPAYRYFEKATPARGGR